MKKIYLSILSVALVSLLNAQVKQLNGPIKRSNDRTEAKVVAVNNNIEKAVTIWESTFGTPSEWVLAHDAADCTLDWEIGVVSCAGSYPIADIASTSAADGWAIVDSDNYGGATGGTDVEDSYITMANAVDLTAYPNVVVQFETYYRSYTSERPFVVVGIGDGTGPASVVWPDMVQSSVIGDPSIYTNVFDAFPNWPTQEASDNPQVMQVNISPALVGLSAAQLGDIYIRLNWTGTWGYAWFVDDFKIIEQPQDDIQNTAAWVVGENNGGIEYGRNPVDHLDANWTIGSEIFNFGVNDQTNVTLTADFVTFSSGGTDPLLLADSTVIIETLETPALAVGTYTGTYTAVSDLEVGGTVFGNNVRTRVFEVTPVDNIYSTDGIDVYPAADLDLTSIGTNSFTGGEDGLVLASMYHIKQTTTVSGMRVMLATGTVAGGEIYGSIIDTTNFWQNDMTGLYLSAGVTVTAAHIATGYVDVPFSAPASLNPGEYYAAIELYSNANANDIRVLDDRTVAQPYYAGSIYIPGDQSYSNGTALGIRLLMGSAWLGLGENTLAGVSIFPNPSEGVITVTNDNGVSNTIVVRDVLGKQVLSKESNSETTLDLSNNGAGVFFVSVTNEAGTLVEKVVIK